MTPRANDGHNLKLPTDLGPAVRPSGACELVLDAEHFQLVVLDGMLKAKVSVDIATADFKAMLVPRPQAPSRGHAPSIVEELAALAQRGVEVRLLHSGVPSGPALEQLRRGRGKALGIRRCPRLHMKAVIIDSDALYLGSANLTGAGLGAKGDTRRNFEAGIWTREPAMIDAVAARFNDLWEGRRCDGCGRQDVCPVPLEEPRL